MSRCELGLPTGLAFGESAFETDREYATRAATRIALAQLGAEGTLVLDGVPPAVEGADVRLSSTCSASRALVVAGRVRYLGIALGPETLPVPALAARYFATLHPFAHSARELAACWTARVAALKALRLPSLDEDASDDGLADSFDDAAVRVASLAPPRLVCGLAPLELIVRIVPEGVLAIVFAR